MSRFYIHAARGDFIAGVEFKPPAKPGGKRKYVTHYRSKLGDAMCFEDEEGATAFNHVLGFLGRQGDIVCEVVAEGILEEFKSHASRKP